MAYLIPRGTPVEVQRGEYLLAYILERDFRFPEPAAEKVEEFIFELDDGSRIAVAKSLVVRNVSKLIK